LTTWPWLNGGRKPIFHSARGDGLTEHLACRLFPPYTFVPPVRRHGLQVELTELSQSSSPTIGRPAGHAIHVSFAFQSSTVRADRKAKLYVYWGPKSETVMTQLSEPRSWKQVEPREEERKRGPIPGRIWGSGRPVVMKHSIFWNIKPCTSGKVNRRFGGACRLHRQVWKVSQTSNQHEAILLFVCFITWLTLQTWGWRPHVPPKTRLIFTGLHGIMSQKIELFNPSH
jgi:hypothetical protein